MSSDSSQPPKRADGRLLRTLWLQIVLLLFPVTLALVVVPGCGGCPKVDEDPLAKRKREEEERIKKLEEEKKKPKDDFEVVGRLAIEPSDATLTRSNVKPGHWVRCVQQLKANNFDVQAELETETVDSKGRPLEIEHTPFRLIVNRPASLPKGQVKHFELTYFLPRPSQREENKQLWLSQKLRYRRSGREIPQGTQQQPTTTMPPYQFYFVVLSSEPNRFVSFTKLDAIKAPTGLVTDEESLLYYRVVLPKIDRRVPLPTHPLTWTSVAYVLWDDLAPSQLEPGQQQAMLDWLHWGGQLMISGPESLDSFRGSFLEPYLPAAVERAAEFVQADFDQLNSAWALRDAKDRAKRHVLQLDPDKPLLGVALKIHDAAQWIDGCENLVAERQVGRGRVVATAFSLSDRRLRRWKCFDGFFNACFLRRPSRKFYEGQDLLGPQVRLVDLAGYENDPRLSTALRYFSRDTGRLSGLNSTTMQDESEEELTDIDRMIRAQRGEFSTPTRNRSQMNKDLWHFGGYQSQPQSGVCGWSDTGAVASAARQSLKEAAGITVPKASFVVQILAIYLIVLVPLNWGFFRLIGRVEWAWIAAPLIAIAGTAAVIRMAQLDIGFVRSRTEIAVLEAHGGYNRAHLTRYTALYSSLSTGYDFQFEDDSALAQPFAVNPTYQRGIHESVRTVSFQFGKDVSLEGFRVDSNSTGVVHSEQMFSLGGSFVLTSTDAGETRVENNTAYPLRDVGLLRMTDRGTLEVAWVGDLKAKTQARLDFRPASGSEPYLPQWEESPTMASGDVTEQGQVRLHELLALASKQLQLRRGETRLIGWTDAELGGVTISPSASQVTLRTFVLVHLTPGELPAPRRDENTRFDVDPNEDLDIFGDQPDLFNGLIAPGNPPGLPQELQDLIDKAEPSRPPLQP